MEPNQKSRNVVEEQVVHNLLPHTSDSSGAASEVIDRIIDTNYSADKISEQSDKAGSDVLNKMNEYIPSEQRNTSTEKMTPSSFKEELLEDDSILLESKTQNPSQDNLTMVGSQFDSDESESVVMLSDTEQNTSDVSSSFAENESITDVNVKSKSILARKPPRRRQPPIMSGYRKRRKIHSKKQEAECSSYEFSNLDASDMGFSFEVGSEAGSNNTLDSSSSEENLPERLGETQFLVRKRSSSSSDTSDTFCWICHKDGSAMFKCIACPRVFHIRCYTQTHGGDLNEDGDNFQCPECVAILKADNVNTRSPTLSTVNLNQLCVSLKHVIYILKIQKDANIFMNAVDSKEFPHYREYVIHPMDLQMLEKNVNNKVYGCTEAFLADVKWIVHNSIVFNSKAAKVTNVAKNLLKICKREISEIETCAECYYNSIVRVDTWFIEVCKKPHLLVWARLKGYPPWPAKALKCKDNAVDCRFFGAHDKAWVPIKDCFLYSKVPPQPSKAKRGSQVDLAFQELEKHIAKLKEKFGIFRYPHPRIPYQSTREVEQLRFMLPNYNPKTGGVLKSLSDVRTVLLPKLTDEESSITTETVNNESEGSSEDESIEVTIEDEPIDVHISETNIHQEQSEPAQNESATKVPMKMTTVSNKVDSVPGSPTYASTFPKPEDETRIHKISSIKSPPAIVATSKLVPVRPINDVTAPAQLRKINVALKSFDSTNVKVVHTLPQKSVTNEVNVGSKTVQSVDLKRVNTEPSGVEQERVRKLQLEPRKLSNETTQENSSELTKKLMKPSEKRGAGMTSPATENRDGDEEATTSKKMKTDASSPRSVNITENVTLSVVDGQKPMRMVNYKEMMATKKQQQPEKKNTLVAKSENADIDGAVVVKRKTQVTPTKSPPAQVVSSQSSTFNKSNVKLITRVVYSNGSANGPVKANAGSGGVTSSNKVAATSPNCSFSTVLNECLMSEYRNHFREFFEKTIEKLAGKGDLKAKVLVLQKEIETLKTSQELSIDEMKRDYETQIAELRATSIAKTQFDLAAERLKLEQEKERAVKEAKSKQWCSNCQKSANYYCCWNTAYCDFECQKEHWIQHMSMCKNDVKKKAAESSENEPPKILMQNDVSNNYTVVNGYDKAGTVYTFHSTNTNSNSKKNSRLQPMKNTTNMSTRSVSATKPLLPRVTSTSISCSPSSTSSNVSTSGVANTGNSSSSEGSLYQNVSSSTINTIRSHAQAMAARKATH